MRHPRFRNATRDFELALSKVADEEMYLLRLYITGATPKSVRAVRNIKAICEEHLRGRYRLEVIDIYQQPVLAKGEQILAAPTLIKHLPPPIRRFIGDMSQKDKILLGLDLKLTAKNRHEDKDHKPPGQKPRF